MKKRVVLLGSTGSVGQSACKVLSLHKDKFELKAVAANINYKMLLHQAQEMNVSELIIGNEDFVDRCRREAPDNIKVSGGLQAMCDRVSMDDVDIVICAILGSVALKPVLAALKCGKTVALASKEVMLAAGELVMDTAEKYGGRIIPVDSEHSALFQCLKMHDVSALKSLVLTCSGGPFRNYSLKDMEKVTLADALKHPVWTMGRKITIDSASLMNKALEVVEAVYLFGVSQEHVNVLVHPEGIIHSLVEFKDNTMAGLFSNPSMELPVQYALSYPDVFFGGVPPLDLAKLASLHFFNVDDSVFPSINIARQALKIGRNMPLVMNSANDVAVQRFCNGSISFVKIWDIIEKTMEKFEITDVYDLESVLEQERIARKIAENI